MNQFLLLGVLFLSITMGLSAQTETPNLLGKITREQLRQEPYAKWFDPQYNDYTPSQEIIAQLKKCNLKEYTFTIFLGTWCGDTQREIPRLLKIFDEMGISSDKVTIIGVNSGNNVHKQSPTGDEKGKHIFRVATILVYKNGKEVNRIVEFPVYSLEKDLLTILTNGEYISNYKSFPFIAKWVDDGTLSDKNVSAMSLAEQIRSVAKNANEIVSAGWVLKEQGKTGEAAKLFRIAYALFPETNYYKSYAEVFIADNKLNDAEYMIKKALAKEIDERKIAELLKVYDQIKEVQKKE